AAPAHKFAVAALRALNTQRDRSGVLALRISRAANELSKAPTLLHQVTAALFALLFEGLIRLVRNPRPGYQSSRRFALRIAAARQERAEPTALEGHFAPAILAVLGLAFLVVQLRSHILDEIAIGISRAPQKESVAADAFQQLAFAALLALPAG